MLMMQPPLRADLLGFDAVFELAAAAGYADAYAVLERRRYASAPLLARLHAIYAIAPSMLRRLRYALFLRRRQPPPRYGCQPPPIRRYCATFVAICHAEMPFRCADFTASSPLSHAAAALL
jgi:hypothetical protein